MTARSRAEQDTPPGKYPAAPDGLTVYAVGDIHGRLDLLLAVQRQIDHDKVRHHRARSLEIYLGDYIDRGPSSAGVVSRLIDRAQEVESVFLRGNHEQMLLDFLRGADCLDAWLAVGGAATLLSYRIAPGLLARTVSAEAVRRQLSTALPPEHLRFYAETEPYARFGAYLAVHAGVRPGVRLEQQSPADLLYIRHEFLQFAGDFGWIVVHGHTPVAAPELRPNRINIDTGAFATNRLTCLRIDADGVHIMPIAAVQK